MTFLGILLYVLSRMPITFLLLMSVMNF